MNRLRPAGCRPSAGTLRSRAVTRPPRGAALSRLKNRTSPPRLSHRLIVHAARAVQPVLLVGGLRVAPALRVHGPLFRRGQVDHASGAWGECVEKGNQGDWGLPVRRFADSTSRISSARRAVARRSCPCFRMRCACTREGVKQGSSSRNGPTVGRGTRGRMRLSSGSAGKIGRRRSALPALRGRRHGTRAPRGGAAKRRDEIEEAAPAGRFGALCEDEACRVRALRG